VRTHSVLAHVAQKLTTQLENVATDALAYVLNEHPDVAKAFGDFIIEQGGTVSTPMTVQSQITADERSRPDLLVTDTDGNVRVVIEGKFDARLTKHQPETYLKQLKTERGLLLFVVPARRQHELRMELAQRCRVLPKARVDGARIAVGDRSVVITTWDSLLSKLADRADDTWAASDIKQIEGICEMSINEEFRPLEAAELKDTEIPFRIKNYVALSLDIVESARQHAVFVPNHRLQGSAQFYSGTYGTFGKFRGWIGFDADAWRRHGLTPLWIEFDMKAELKSIKTRLESWLNSAPPKAFKHEVHGNILVPILLATNADHDEVVGRAVDQVTAVAREFGPK
jgi:hypothetical protein